MPSKLIELEIARPGVFGVNTSASGDVMPKEYSVKADNFVFSDEGYLEARHGSLRTSANPVTGTVRKIYETKNELGADLIIYATATKIYRKTAASFVDITGTAVCTAGNWKFTNLNNEIFGTQDGHAAIKLGTPSTGTFAPATFTGTDAPTEINIVDSLAAFGRLWHLYDDKLVYSSLLFPEDYDPTGKDAGYFNLTASYLKGKAKPTALAEFNGNLLVFTDNHVTVWEYPWNPNATATGISSLTAGEMGILETIGGVGCVARDTIQYTQNDILFLSEQGVTSLSRVVQEKSMPLSRYSDNVKANVQGLIREVDVSTIWSAYLEAEGIYFLGAPSSPRAYLIDTATRLPDETFRTLTWSKTIHEMEVVHEGQLTASDDAWAAVLISDEASYLSQVKGYNDYTPQNGIGGSSYILTWESAWSSILEDFENHLKMPKKLGVVVKGTGAVNFAINLAFDYGDFTDSKARTALLTLSSPSKYGSAQYNVSTYGGAAAIKESKFMGFGAGRIMKTKITSTVDGELVSMQRVSIKSKIGKQS